MIDKRTKLANLAGVFCCFLCVFGGIIVFCSGGCSILHFTPHLSGRALRGHVIRTVEVVDHHGNCNVMCVMTEYCVSFNLGPPLQNGTRICQVSDSDHIRHPEDLVPRDGFVYSATENACSSDPCVSNASCKPDFEQNHYSCVCPAGFQGRFCNNDVDECSSIHPTCDVNAICTNTVGSYKCACREGFLGDGKRCTGYIARIDIVSNGISDPVKVAGFCSIKINGVEHCPRKRGHNIVARMLDGTITRGYFDTYGDRNAGKNLAAWINALPFDTVVLVAAADSASNYYMDATTALKSVGAVDPLMGGFRSSWYLVGYKGAAKSWIRQGTAERGKGPSRATVENIRYSN